MLKSIVLKSILWMVATYAVAAKRAEMVYLVDVQYDDVQVKRCGMLHVLLNMVVGGLYLVGCNLLHVEVEQPAYVPLEGPPRL